MVKANLATAKGMYFIILCKEEERGNSGEQRESIEVDYYQDDTEMKNGHFVLIWRR